MNMCGYVKAFGRGGEAFGGEFVAGRLTYVHTVVRVWSQYIGDVPLFCRYMLHKNRGRAMVLSGIIHIWTRPYRFCSTELPAEYRLLNVSLCRAVVSSCLALVWNVCTERVFEMLEWSLIFFLLATSYE